MRRRKNTLQIVLYKETDKKNQYQRSYCNHNPMRPLHPGTNPAPDDLLDVEDLTAPISSDADYVVDKSC